MSFENPINTFFSITPARTFGGTKVPNSNRFTPLFSGYVTLSESTVDELEITQQPVQRGASISDHAFKKPTVLSVQLVFGSNGLGSHKLNGTSTDSLASVYENLLLLQNSGIPSVVSTVKRTYKDMLISALGVTTDKKTENVLAVSIRFQQVIIVNVGIVLVPKSQLKHPGKNQATQKVGRKQSVLSQVFGPAAPFGPVKP